MGNTPSRKNRKLEKAIQGRKTKRVKRWISKGADPNGYSKKSNYSFLSMAVTLREEDLVKVLLQNGADPNQKSWLASGKGTLQHKQNNDDEYPIHIAASHGNTKIMEALLNSEININVGQDHKLGTALHQAARFGHSKLAELLLNNGADIIGFDSRCNIPLHIAATFGHTKVAEVLLRYGSPINISNMKSWTALHCASSEGAVSMARLLLRQGADPKLKDGTGNTPIDVVKSDAVLRIFLEHAIENPEDEIFGVKDGVDSQETVPPKPARTFAFTSSVVGQNTSRGRTQSQGAEIENDPDPRTLKISKSYSEFGKWLRNREQRSQKKQKKTEKKIPKNFRRTKSTPAKRKKTKVHSKSKTTEKKMPKRSSSLKIIREKEPAEQVRTYSVRYRKLSSASTSTVGREQGGKCSNDLKKSHKRSKSSSALGETREVTINGEVERRLVNVKRGEEQNEADSAKAHELINFVTDQKTHDNVAQQPCCETEAMNGNVPMFLHSKLSRSFQNLVIISEDAEKGFRDTNFNLESKVSVHRTKSDFQPKKRGREMVLENMRSAS